MTKQESFKRRVRARMARTGERYTTARQALLAKAGNRSRPWAAQPEMSDEAVLAATGRGWDEWCDVLDGWAVDPWDHAAVASRLQDDLGVDGWWAQSVTVGYERITGLRLPYQRPDGTFTAGKSRVVNVDGDLLRKLLVSDEHRADLFPGHGTELRSKPDAKTIRLGIGSGVALIRLERKNDGRTSVSINHEKLQRPDDVDRWKFWWSEWLDSLDEG